VFKKTVNEVSVFVVDVPEKIAQWRPSHSVLFGSFYY